MVIPFGATRNLYQVLPTVLNSLIINNKKYLKKIYLFIEDDRIDYLNNKLIEFININNYSHFFDKNCPNLNSEYSNLVFFKLFSTKILKEEKVLWLDVDMIIDGSIKELWDIDLKGYIYGMALEPVKTNYYKHPYYNAGCLLVNNKILNELRYIDVLINAINTKKFKFIEQDCINELFWEDIYEIDSKFNACFWTKKSDMVVIRHYAAEQKPWDKKDELWNKYYVDKI